MGVSEVLEHKHSGGRLCRLIRGQWRYGEHHQFICTADHKVAEKLDEITDDRGEFGMPGLGNDDIITHTPEWNGPVGRLIETRIVNEGWRFHANTFTTEHSDGKGQSLEMPSDDARIIFSDILPTLLATFLEKNQKYAAVEDGYDLGAKGIVPDLNRKLGIIKARIWDGAEEVGESTDEVVEDMVGHLLLFLAKRRRGE